MQRALLADLKHWFHGENRKPLVLRGARQVGKTWLVRHFAETMGKQLIELNFEKNPVWSSLFNTNDPRQILLNISAALGVEINPEKSLLFLDEIQVAPQLLAQLRWFAEDCPQLPVIATGSLLEFVLADHTFSMPVGRINYLYLEPLSFEEFLLALDKKTLLNYLKHYEFQNVIPEAIHQEFMACFKQYVFVGGLPASVLSWLNHSTVSTVNQVQQDLLATYRDDFAKYRGRIAIERLQEVMIAVPRMLGQKFVSSRVNSEVQAASVKQALGLLEKARLAHRVLSCAANGVPMAAEANEKYVKTIFIDVGLCIAALGLRWDDLASIDTLTLINKGGITEQVVGQLLRTIEPAYVEPALYYWQRDEKGSVAEVDYIIQQGSRLIPIEVKAGATGSLKSLHVLMGLKKWPLAVRVNADVPSCVNANVKNHAGQPVEYTLLSIPFYLVGQIHRLIDQCK